MEPSLPIHYGVSKMLLVDPIHRDLFLHMFSSVQGYTCAAIDEHSYFFSFNDAEKWVFATLLFCDPSNHELAMLCYRPGMAIRILSELLLPRSTLSHQFQSSSLESKERDETMTTTQTQTIYFRDGFSGVKHKEFYLPHVTYSDNTEKQRICTLLQSYFEEQVMAYHDPECGDIGPFHNVDVFHPDGYQLHNIRRFKKFVSRVESSFKNSILEQDKRRRIKQQPEICLFSGTTELGDPVYAKSKRIYQRHHSSPTTNMSTATTTTTAVITSSDSADKTNARFLVNKRKRTNYKDDNFRKDDDEDDSDTKDNDGDDDDDQSSAAVLYNFQEIIEAMNIVFGASITQEQFALLKTTLSSKKHSDEPTSTFMPSIINTSQEDPNSTAFMATIRPRYKYTKIIFETKK